VSLGYISEIERGQKEASSEMLGALCEALQVPLSSVLREVSDRLVVDETRRAYAKAAQSGAETRLLALAVESSEQVGPRGRLARQRRRRRRLTAGTGPRRGSVRRAAAAPSESPRSPACSSAWPSAVPCTCSPSARSTVTLPSDPSRTASASASTAGRSCSSLSLKVNSVRPPRST
jgi:transcriptional regulator with XRE-family HTH domain